MQPLNFQQKALHFLQEAAFVPTGKALNQAVEKVALDSFENRTPQDMMGAVITLKEMIHEAKTISPYEVELQGAFNALISLSSSRDEHIQQAALAEMTALGRFFEEEGRVKSQLARAEPRPVDQLLERLSDSSPLEKTFFSKTQILLGRRLLSEVQIKALKDIFQQDPDTFKKLTILVQKLVEARGNTLRAMREDKGAMSTRNLPWNEALFELFIELKLKFHENELLMPLLSELLETSMLSNVQIYTDFMEFATLESRGERYIHEIERSANTYHEAHHPSSEKLLKLAQLVHASPEEVAGFWRHGDTLTLEKVRWKEVSSSPTLPFISGKVEVTFMGVGGKIKKAEAELNLAPLAFHEEAEVVKYLAFLREGLSDCSDSFLNTWIMMSKSGKRPQEIMDANPPPRPLLDLLSRTTQKALALDIFVKFHYTMHRELSLARFLVNE